MYELSRIVSVVIKAGISNSVAGPPLFLLDGNAEACSASTFASAASGESISRGQNR
jgi:hypothetical protein